MTTSEATTPEAFSAAIESMLAAQIRPEISVGPIRPPQRLAPFSYAVGLEVTHPQDEDAPEPAGGEAFGRLILLHDPQGEETWRGSMRLVAYIQADMDAQVAEDPLLPQVAWQWLTEGLQVSDADFSSLGGTVTATQSVRFGDLSGPPQAYQLEMRSSWTAESEDLGPHLAAFAQLLANVAGLPPEGVRLLGS